MSLNDAQKELLRRLPGVDQLLLQLEAMPELAAVPKAVTVRSIRETLENLRRDILKGPDQLSGQKFEQISDQISEDAVSLPMLTKRIRRRIDRLQTFNLKKIINATGVVVHTNLGRSCLAPEAIAHMVAIAEGYSNLEFDLDKGRRGSRYQAVEDLLCELGGCEAAMAVNNNAAAVLLCLDTLARGREVILSRGELVEIGGSFRIPDVMTKSGAVLKEVGTTNRTHLADYERAIGSDSGLLLKVHTSNYTIQGFTASVGLADLVALGGKFNLPIMEDLGSGTLVDFSKFGLAAEPTVQQSLSAGVDVVTFSGDKLLGGPQAGLILGRRDILDRIKSNPLTRALRIDKLTLSALEATLRLYRDEARAMTHIPTLAMLTAKLPELEQRAGQLAQGLRGLKDNGQSDNRLNVDLLHLPSRAGGGALPMHDLASCCVAVTMTGKSADQIEKQLRAHTPPILGRIENDQFLMDPRTLSPQDIQVITDAFSRILYPEDSNDLGDF